MDKLWHLDTCCWNLKHSKARALAGLGESGRHGMRPAMIYADSSHSCRPSIECQMCYILFWLNPYFGGWTPVCIAWFLMVFSFVTQCCPTLQSSHSQAVCKRCSLAIDRCGSRDEIRGQLLPAAASCLHPGNGSNYESPKWLALEVGLIRQQTTTSVPLVHNLRAISVL